MTTFDPSVYTSDPAPHRAAWHTLGGDGEQRVSYLNKGDTGGAVRSILPIPSAEEHAALVKLGDAATRWRDEQRKWHGMPGMTKPEIREWKLQQSVVGECYVALLDAIDSLDAARKERGQ